MKPYIVFFGTALLVILIGIVVVGQQFSAVTPSGAVTACPSPVAGSNILCSVTDGYYASISGAAYVKLNASSAQSPTVISCTTAQLSSGTTGTFTASGCTLK